MFSRWTPVREGWPAIALGGLLGGLFVRKNPLLATAPIALAGAVAWTLRDPDRPIARDSRQALSPADGRIIHIEQVWDDFWEIEMTEVAIFLAIWDLHVQRSPADGIVVAQERRGNKYGPAMRSDATRWNNQLSTYLDTAAGPMVITQISGLVARRIVSTTPIGTAVGQGDRTGLIKLSSQVALRVPTSADIVVRRDEQVQAGLTPIARLQPS